MKTAAGVGYEIHVVDRAYEDRVLRLFPHLYTHIKDEVISYYAFTHMKRENYLRT